MNTYSYVVYINGIVEANNAEEAHEIMCKRLEKELSESKRATLSLLGYEDEIEVSMACEYTDGVMKKCKTEREVW